MSGIEIGIIGTGWCGGIRAAATADHPLVSALHIAEIRPERLAEVAATTHPASATTAWQALLARETIEAVMISATPETTHYPMGREALRAGKHVFLEKPIAMTLDEADESVALARSSGLKFTIGYSQRFNPKYAHVRKAIAEGTIGRPVSALVSRHITRELGKKISGRVKLSPAATKSTHDLDFLLWCLAPAKPTRVYSQVNYGAMREGAGGADIPDLQWMMVTLDSGLSLVVGGGWSLPPGYPNFATTWIEIVGAEGALMADDTHRDAVLNTMKDGMRLPLSTMPGEPLGHVFAGPMAAETLHFIDAVARDRPALVTPEEARQVMEVYIAADLSAETNEPITLPLANKVAAAA